MYRYIVPSIFLLYTLPRIASSYRFTHGTCPDHLYMCETGLSKFSNKNYNGRGCLISSWLCDNEYDCIDRSDEKYCPYNFDYIPETTEPKLTTPKRIVVSTINRTPENAESESVEQEEYIKLRSSGQCAGLNRIQELEAAEEDSVITTDHLDNLLPEIVEELKDSGQIPAPTQQEVEGGFMSWLREEIRKEIQRLLQDKEFIAGVVKAVIKQGEELTDENSGTDSKQLEGDEADAGVEDSNQDLIVTQQSEADEKSQEEERDKEED